MSNASLMLCVLLLAFIGCSDNRGVTESLPTVSDLPNGTWTVTGVDLDRGHFTWDNGDGLYHTYVMGVECKRGAQRIILLYEDQLPDGLTLSVGEQLDIEANDSEADYDADWGGFWIQKLEITKRQR